MARQTSGGLALIPFGTEPGEVLLLVFFKGSPQQRTTKKVNLQ